jgi:hypothetical protein
MKRFRFFALVCFLARLSLVGAAFGQHPAPQTTTQVFAPGELRVTTEPSELFLDGFDAGLDTVNRWKPPTAAGGGVAASNVVSDTVLQTGTTANGYSYLESVPSFPPLNPGWLLIDYGINLESPVILNSYRFWGTGTSPATPTAAIPIQEGAGFEVNTDGKLYAVMYAGGGRNVVQDLSYATGNRTQPQDTAVHYYSMFYRGDRVFWTIDSLTNIVAYTVNGGPGPNINTLPLKATAIAGAVAPASSANLQINVVYVGDTAHNNSQISDGVLPWRKATVTQAGGLVVAPGGNTYTHITTTTATAAKATPGLLHTLTINTPAAGTVSVFDLATAACTGTPATNIVAVMTAIAATPPETYIYDTQLLNGICVKASVAMDLTVAVQ